MAAQQAFHLTLDGHPKTPEYLSSLGSPFAGLFGRLGDCSKPSASSQNARSDKPACLDNLETSFRLSASVTLPLMKQPPLGSRPSILPRMVTPTSPRVSVTSETLV